MNVITSVEQDLFPFDFYTDSRNKHPINSDPQHKYLRDSIAMTFNPKNIAKLEPIIETI
jgi:hypothetical protein